jgi:hypothetical protein
MLVNATVSPFFYTHHTTQTRLSMYVVDLLNIRRSNVTKFKEISNLRDDVDAAAFDTRENSIAAISSNRI